jgi:hypothetical protein
VPGVAGIVKLHGSAWFPYCAATPNVQSAVETAVGADDDAACLLVEAPRTYASSNLTFANSLVLVRI